MMDLFQKIQDKMPSLSKSHRRIAQYILSEPDKAAFMTANALGDALQISESTVVRLAGELGFDGYPQMQRKLQQLIMMQLGNFCAEKSHSEKINRTNRTFFEDIDKIRLVLGQIDPFVVNKIVAAMQGARRIYVVGARAASTAAFYLYENLNMIFEDVRLITSASDTEVAERLLRMNQEDFLISIALLPDVASARRALFCANDVAAKTLLVTDGEPMGYTCESALILRVNDSPIALVSVMRALADAAAQACKREAAEYFERMEKVLYYADNEYDN